MSHVTTALVTEPQMLS